MEGKNWRHLKDKQNRESQSVPTLCAVHGSLIIPFLWHLTFLLHDYNGISILKRRNSRNRYALNTFRLDVGGLRIYNSFFQLCHCFNIKNSVCHLGLSYAIKFVSISNGKQNIEKLFGRFKHQVEQFHNRET